MIAPAAVVERFLSRQRAKERLRRARGLRVDGRTPRETVFIRREVLRAMSLLVPQMPGELHAILRDDIGASVTKREVQEAILWLARTQLVVRSADGWLRAPEGEVAGGIRKAVSARQRPPRPASPRSPPARSGGSSPGSRSSRRA